MLGKYFIKVNPFTNAHSNGHNTRTQHNKDAVEHYHPANIHTEYKTCLATNQSVILLFHEKFAQVQ